MSATKRERDLLTEALRGASGDMLRYLQRRVGAEDAADLLGEAMVIAWRRVSELPTEPAEARMWLFGLARGTLLNHARGERRRRSLADKVRTHMVGAQVAPAADEGGDIRDAIDRLSPQHSEVVKLVHWDGFTLVEAAAIIGIPAPTARGRYSRAKEELRALLGVHA